MKEWVFITVLSTKKKQTSGIVTVVEITCHIIKAVIFGAPSAKVPKTKVCYYKKNFNWMIFVKFMLRVCGIHLAVSWIQKGLKTTAVVL